jgi:hypothetical protein
VSSFRPFSRGSAPGPADPGNERDAERPVPTATEAAAELRRSLHEVAKQAVDELVASAETAAEEIHREAESAADRYAETRRREVDVMVEGVRTRMEEAFGSLRAEIAEIESRALSATVEAARPDADPAPPDSVEPAAAEPAGSQVRPAAGGERNTALATAGQLASIGRDRGEIEAVLRKDFGIERPGEIVNEVLPPR